MLNLPSSDFEVKILVTHGARCTASIYSCSVSYEFKHTNRTDKKSEDISVVYIQFVADLLLNSKLLENCDVITH